ncbi:MAG: HD domain-containing protein [Campylobacterota bacterium]|nr:HD domain-containing protein [Campylobacterota bacterium]
MFKQFFNTLTVRVKVLVLIFLALVIQSTLLYFGVRYYYVNIQFTKETKQATQERFHEINNHIKEVATDLKSFGDNIAQDTKSIAILNLLKYASPNNYDNFLYDTEKLKLLSLVKEYGVVLRRKWFVEIFDHKGELIAYYDMTNGKVHKQISTYQNNQKCYISEFNSQCQTSNDVMAHILVSTKSPKEPYLDLEIDHVLLKPKLVYARPIFRIQSSGKPKRIGHLRVSEILSDSYFKVDHSHGTPSATGYYVTDEIQYSAFGNRFSHEEISQASLSHVQRWEHFFSVKHDFVLQEVNGFYLHAHVLQTGDKPLYIYIAFKNKDIVNVLDKIQYTIATIAIIVLLLVIPIAYFLIAKGFTKRFEHLSSMIQDIDIKNLKPIQNLTGSDEIALIVHNINDLISRIDSMTADREKNFEEVIQTFVDMIEQRDTYTAGHNRRVAEYCVLIAKEMGYTSQEIELLRKSALMHDIGKIQTPDSILLKPGQLTKNEYELIKEHASVGYTILSQIEMYKPYAEIIKYHHERYDGKGYPNGFKGDEIPPLSKILILADAFDAMTTTRIYKPRKNISKALEEIKQSSKTQFHPEVVQAAMIALKDVVVDVNINQLPHSKIERERFAYFYKDKLTGCYNQDFLEVFRFIIFPTLNNVHVLQIDIDKFNTFVNNNSWEIGDNILRMIGDKLVNSFEEYYCFRLKGDDFYIIYDHKKHDMVQELAMQYLEPVIKKYDILLKMDSAPFESMNFSDSINLLNATQVKGSSLQLYQSAMDVMDDLIFLKDNSLTYVACNEAFLKFVGKEKSEIIGHNDFEIFDQKFADLFRQMDKKMFETGSKNINKEWVKYPDNSDVHLLTVKSPLRNKEGIVIGLVGISKPIS